MPFQITLDEWMEEEFRKKQKQPKPPKPPKPPARDPRKLKKPTLKKEKY